MRVNEIETAVRKRQLFRIVHKETSLKAERLEMQERRVYGSRREIDARIVRTRQGEHYPVGSITAADLKDPLAFRFGEGNKKRNMPFGFVAKATVRLIKLKRSSFCIYKVAATRLRIPEALNIVE